MYIYNCIKDKRKHVALQIKQRRLHRSIICLSNLNQFNTSFHNVMKDIHLYVYLDCNCYFLYLYLDIYIYLDLYTNICIYNYVKKLSKSIFEIY